MKHTAFGMCSLIGHVDELIARCRLRSNRGQLGATAYAEWCQARPVRTGRGDAHQPPDIGAFVLVTGNSDFRPLVAKLGEFGKHVVASAQKRSPAHSSSRSVPSSNFGARSSSASNQVPTSPGPYLALPSPTTRPARPSHGTATHRHADCRLGQGEDDRP
jgi:hypothetical protein